MLPRRLLGSSRTWRGRGRYCPAPHAYYRDLTVRLAELGWDAVAIDFFARTAEHEDRSDAFEFWPHVQQTTSEGVAADVAAAVAHLRGQGVEHVFTLGFCFGGGYSWRQSADTPGLAGCIGFYGRAERAAEVQDRLAAPLLLLQAGADEHIPVAAAAAFVEGTQVPATLVVFDDLPHSFFDRTAPEHESACIRAWREIIQFVARYAV